VYVELPVTADESAGRLLAETLGALAYRPAGSLRDWRGRARQFRSLLADRASWSIVDNAGMHSRLALSCAAGRLRGAGDQPHHHPPCRFRRDFGCHPLEDPESPPVWRRCSADTAVDARAVAARPS